MHKLEPGVTHPLYWILTEVFGATEAEIRSRGPFSRSDLRMLREQYPIKPNKIRRLIQLVEKMRDEIASRLSPRRSAERKPSGVFRYYYRSAELEEYRAAVFRTVNWAVEAYRPLAERPSALPRETDLSVELLTTIGRGARRSVVVRNLRVRHRHGAITRCARRIGVREAIVDGVAWWYPPRDLPSIAGRPAPVAVPAPVIRKSPRAARVQQLLELALIRHPEGRPAREVIAEVMARAECNRTAVLRAARDLRILRETTGFGAAKRTTWVYQAAIDAAHRDRKLRRDPESES